MTPKDDFPESVLDDIGPEFLEAGARKVDLAKVRLVASVAEEILDRFETGDSLRPYAADAETMLCLVNDHLVGRYERATLRSIALIVFAMAYVRKPIDIIPDEVPVIGEIDDALVVEHCTRMIADDLEAYRAWRRLRED